MLVVLFCAMFYAKKVQVKLGGLFPWFKNYWYAYHLHIQRRRYYKDDASPADEQRQSLISGDVCIP